MNPIKPRPAALVQILAIILAALAATAQTKPDANATNAAVSAAEVTAFMQASNDVSWGSPDPKRVPMLLAAIQREPAGPWVMFLQRYCFLLEHAGASRLPPEQAQRFAF